jgi:hypothetical protein
VQRQPIYVALARPGGFSHSPAQVKFRKKLDLAGIEPGTRPSPGAHQTPRPPPNLIPSTIYADLSTCSQNSHASPSFLQPFWIRIDELWPHQRWNCQSVPSFPTPSLHAKLFGRMTVHLSASGSISRGFRRFQSINRTVFDNICAPRLSSIVSKYRAGIAVLIRELCPSYPVRYIFMSQVNQRNRGRCRQGPALFRLFGSLLQDWMPSERFDLSNWMQAAVLCVLT